MNINIRRPGGSLSGFVSQPGEASLQAYLSGFTNLDKAVAHHLRNQSVGLLQAVNVDVGARGNGIGSELVAQFYLEARRAGATAFVLVCDEDQLQREGFDLQNWYQALGFGSVFGTSSGPLMVAPEALCTEMRAEFGQDLVCDEEDDFVF